jgi:site-specific recombinase XerD
VGDFEAGAATSARPTLANGATARRRLGAVPIRRLPKTNTLGETVSELAARWLERDPAKRNSTLERDETILRLHILPAIGDRRIADITPSEIQHLVSRWSELLAPRTVTRQYAVVTAMFEYAAVCEWIERSPCRAVRLPRAEPLDRTPLTPEDVARISEAMDERFRPMVWVGRAAGIALG